MPPVVVSQDRAAGAALAVALADAARLSPWLGAACAPPPAGACSIAGLAAEPPLLREVAARAAAALGTDRHDVAAGLVFHDLAWRVVAPSLASVMVGGVAPALAADGVAVVLDGRGASTAVHLAPVTAEVDACGEQRRPALLRLVRDGAVATLTPLVAAMRPLARCGEPALWGEVADTIASAMQSLGDLLDDGAACRAAADELLDGTPPLRGGTNWVAVDHAGLRCTWRVRNSCCRAYRLDAHDYCSGCPLLDADERMARFRQQNQARVAARPA